ncbi:SDR family oxidoreductase [uncultured Devosia sp.]|uniref:SDR family oxidoreductase n=1 Tax=uncultured Devosia sp. TaxID=211434 RepID=UPI0026069B2E|nr:SDR family oxidoreductase [uncultured Devosia sp.]
MSTSPTPDLTGKVVLITGTRRGIGAAAAGHLAALGADIVALNRSVADRSTPGMALECDVSDLDAVARAMDRVARSKGRVDVLINNAGTIEPIARIIDSDPADWSHAIATNLTGAYAVARLALPLLLKAGGGTIINISSGAATSALEGWSHYCASKAGLRALTACMDVELRGRGIRVIGLSPGTVATDMQTAIRASAINAVSRLSPSVHLSPDWVAKAIAFLCTAEADPYLGTDFSLKTEEGRRLSGLPPLGPSA